MTKLKLGDKVEVVTSTGDDPPVGTKGVVCMSKVSEVVRVDWAPWSEGHSYTGLLDGNTGWTMLPSEVVKI